MGELAILLIIILGAVIGIILLISILKVHPAIALLIVSVITSLVLGFNISETLFYLWDGFYSIITGIGIIILLGTLLGAYMEQTGALSTLTHYVLKIFGKKKPLTAVSILGSVVGIPVFCDSGFIILSKVAQNVAKSRHLPRSMTSLGLAGGLYITHTLIPPTPGPLASAANLNMSNQLGLVIITGILISFPILIMSVFSLKKLYKMDQLIEIKEIEPHREKSNLWLLLPIVMAIFLIASGTLIDFIFTSSEFVKYIDWITHPAAALTFACFIAIMQLKQTDLLKKHTLTAIKQAIPIILITGAGGAFGMVLRQSELSNLLSDLFTGTDTSLLLILIIGFIMAFILKSAQGSSTAALVITSSIMVSITGNFSLSPLQMAFVISAIGSGAMGVSHANDSFFWVVTKFSDISVKEGYQKFSLLTLILSITGLVASIVGFVAASI